MGNYACERKTKEQSDEKQKLPGGDFYSLTAFSFSTPALGHAFAHSICQHSHKRFRHIWNRSPAMFFISFYAKCVQSGFILTHDLDLLPPKSQLQEFCPVLLTRWFVRFHFAIRFFRTVRLKMNQLLYSLYVIRRHSCADVAIICV